MRPRRGQATGSRRVTIGGQMDNDDQSLRAALEELERSARSIVRITEQLRASPELLTSAEVRAVISSAKEISAEIQLADPPHD